MWPMWLRRTFFVLGFPPSEDKRRDFLPCTQASVLFSENTHTCVFLEAKAATFLIFFYTPAFCPGARERTLCSSAAALLSKSRVWNFHRRHVFCSLLGKVHFIENTRKCAINFTSSTTFGKFLSSCHNMRGYLEKRNKLRGVGCAGIKG
jgi:hypothetical protein